MEDNVVLFGVPMMMDGRTKGYASQAQTCAVQTTTVPNEHLMMVPGDISMNVLVWGEQHAFQW